MKYSSRTANKAGGMFPDHQYAMVRNRHYNAQNYHYHRPHNYRNQQGGGHRSAIELIAELGSESNAHGLAKIVTSRDTKRKVIWALLVIVGFTAATLQLSLLVRKYLQFQVVELSEIKYSMPVQFPSVTVCNIEPISLRKITELVARNESQNLKEWLAFVHSQKFENKPFMESVRAFYENLGKDALNVSHELDDLLVHCRFNRDKCSADNFTTFFDGNYFNCFTFNGGGQADQIEMHGTGPENGLSLIISIEKFDPLPGVYGVYNLENNILHSAGIRVVVHAPGSMPSPVDQGFDIPPGYSSSVGLKAILNTRLAQPYGNCSTDTLMGIQTFRNTFFACLQLCKQRIIYQRCKCKSSALPNLPDIDAPFCGVIPDWKTIYKNESGGGYFVPTPSLSCEVRNQKDLNNNRTYESECGCYQPCSEISYLKSVSLSYWPLEFYQLNALNKFYSEEFLRKEQHFLNKAHSYLTNITQMGQNRWAQNNTTPEDMIELSKNISAKEMAAEASNLIRQNVLRLNIYLEDLSVVEYRQLPAYGLADLFADIGGTLGLWMGISVLTIMELIELIIRLINLLFNAEKEIPNMPGSNSNHSNTSQLHPLANGDVEHGHDSNNGNYPDLAPTNFDFRRGVESPV